VNQALAAEGRPGASATAPRRRRARPLLFIAPALTVSLGVVAFPLLYSIRVSLYDYTLQTGVQRFVGAANYLDALRDPRFLAAWIVTMRIALPALAIEFLAGLGLALLLQTLRGPLRSLVASLLAAPVLIPGAAAAMAFAMMYVERYGVADALLAFILRRPVDVAWLSSVSIAPWSVVLVEVWNKTSFVMLFLLAGLAVIPTEIYDAAGVDGATGWAVFQHVTFPLLMPTIVAVLALRLIDLMKMFDIPFLLTGGGPGAATEPVSMYIVETGFKSLRVGLGAAQSWLLVAVVAGLLLCFLQSMRFARSAA
jgi:multiple sugar transport system permease protein